MSRLDIRMSRLDKRMSRLDIRMSVPTMLVLVTLHSATWPYIAPGEEVHDNINSYGSISDFQVGLSTAKVF